MFLYRTLVTKICGEKITTKTNFRGNWKRVRNLHRPKRSFITKKNPTTKQLLTWDQNKKKIYIYALHQSSFAQLDLFSMVLCIFQFCCLIIAKPTKPNQHQQQFTLQSSQTAAIVDRSVGLSLARSLVHSFGPLQMTGVKVNRFQWFHSIVVQIMNEN